MITSITEFNQVSINLKYHIDNNIPITENVFRPGSDTFFTLLSETRNLYVNNAIKLCAIDEHIFSTTDIGLTGIYENKTVYLDIPMENLEYLNEAEYKDKNVDLNYPMRNTGSGKKYYVYVKNPDTGNVMKIYFGDVKGGLSVKISDPEARKQFAARHKCSTKKDKTKPGYWACRVNRYGHLFNGKTYPGYW